MSTISLKLNLDCPETKEILKAIIFASEGRKIVEINKKEVVFQDFDEKKFKSIQNEKNKNVKLDKDIGNKPKKEPEKINNLSHDSSLAQVRKGGRMERNNQVSSDMFSVKKNNGFFDIPDLTDDDINNALNRLEREIQTPKLTPEQEIAMLKRKIAREEARRS